MVKYTGKKSAASLIMKLLGVAWFLGLIFSLLLVGFQLYLLLWQPQLLGAEMMMQIETPGLVFRFTDGFSAPSAQKLFSYQFAFVLPLIALGLLVIYQLRKIFATLVNETPFTFDNGRRIKIIGLAIIAGSIIKVILNLLLGLYFSSLVNLPGLELIANVRLVDFGGVIIGVLIIILAEVFNHGTRLQEEQDLTV